MADTTEQARELSAALRAMRGPWLGDGHRKIHAPDAADTIDALAAKLEQMREADILARYSLDDGRREWVNVGTWLYPGEVIAHMDGAALAQEPAAPAPMEPQDARAWWRPSVLPECGPCVTMCRDEADSWLMQGLAAHPLYDAAAIASARRETLKRAAWLAIERPGHFSSFAKAEEFAAALRAMNDGEG